MTFTVIDWVDVFIRKDYKFIITDSLNYCIENKGLIVSGWVLMSNHLHLIARAKDDYQISDIIRDFKKHTSKEILKAIKEADESRKEWMLNKFAYAAKRIKRVKNYKFWRDDNHAIVLKNSSILEQKLNYIHENPVRAMIVEEPWHYLYSSARDYSDMEGLVKVELI